MKLGFCLSAFVAGCFMTVFMKANAPHKATADNAVARPTAEPLAQQTPFFDQESTEMKIIARPFGTTKAGLEVQKYTCRNSNGYVLELIDYGATVTAFQAPDRLGNVENITLGCSDLEGYEACTSFFGSTVGRFCNRIANGRFSINGHEYTLATNNGPHHLHGGKNGFDRRIWQSEQILDRESGRVGARFSLKSEDGDEGYPGNLTVVVEYVLSDANELTIDITAQADKPTHVNLTNHAAWNLGGAGSGKINDHVLKIEAGQYLPVDDQSIPTGSMANVDGTPFDFRAGKKIGDRIQDVDADPVGYDHNFVLRSGGGKLSLAATVACPKTGRVMEVHTTQPGIQFYTCNYLNGQPGSGGFDRHDALCLETQHFPDAPNQPSFGSTLLKPGQTFRQTTIHRFSVRN